MKQRCCRGFSGRIWSNKAIYKDSGLILKYQVQYFYRLPAKETARDRFHLRDTAPAFDPTMNRAATESDRISG